jgi:uncharacterized MAPEG superfamily protein
VHTWTFRNEQQRLVSDYQGNPVNEYLQFTGSASTACSPTSPTPRSRPASCSVSSVTRMPEAASRATATARGTRSRSAIENRREPLAARLAHHAFLADDCIVESVQFDARGSPPARLEKIAPAFSAPASRAAARLVYLPLCTAGVPLLRSIVWNVAFAGNVLLLHRTCPLFDVKRTWRFALQMSAFDPKRTSRSPLTACLARHLFYCALTQLSDPVSLTATSEKKTRVGLPSAVPR